MIKEGQTIEHPKWCGLLCDDCWSVLLGAADEEYCKQCECEFHRDNNPVNHVFMDEEGR